jgi:hypothetical protein
MRRSRGRGNGLDHALAPERGDRQRSKQLFVIGGKEEAVPLRAGAPASPPSKQLQSRFMSSSADMRVNAGSFGKICYQCG